MVVYLPFKLSLIMFLAVVGERLIPQDEPTRNRWSLKELLSQRIKGVSPLTATSWVSVVKRPVVDDKGYLKCNVDPRLKSCDAEVHYPEKGISYLLKETKSQEMQPEGPLPNIVLPERTIDYNAGGNVVFPPCIERTIVIYPRAGFSASFGAVYIINSKGMKQPVVAQVCELYHAKCSADGYGMGGVCQQRFGLARLHVLHPSENRIVRSQVEVPVGCQCYKTLLENLHNQQLVENEVNLVSGTQPFLILYLLLPCFFVIVLL